MALGLKSCVGQRLKNFTSLASVNLLQESPSDEGVQFPIRAVSFALYVYNSALG